MRSRVSRLSLSAAILLAAFLGLLLATVLSIAGWRFILGSSRDAANILEMMKVALAITAGVGGVVALVVSVRRQRLGELEHDFTAGANERDQTRLRHERFQTAASMLGSDKAATRMAGAYSIAVLADDWLAQRQMCIDVLCAYLRLPLDVLGEPAEVNVRKTVLGLIRAHLTQDAPSGWHGHVFDLHGAQFVAGSLDGIRAGGSRLLFSGARFSSAGLTMDHMVLDDGLLDFSGVTFDGATLSLKSSHMSGGILRFDDADFTNGSLKLDKLNLTGGTVSLQRALLEGTVSLEGAIIRTPVDDAVGNIRPLISFARAEIASGCVDFSRSRIMAAELRLPGQIDLVSGPGGNIPMAVDFGAMQIRGGEIDFWLSEIRQVLLSFGGATLTGGKLRFRSAHLESASVSFQNATISGGVICWEANILRYPESWVDEEPAWLRELREASPQELREPRAYSHRPRPVGYVEFWDAMITGGRVMLTGLDVEGGTFNFVGMQMTGGEIEFSQSHLHNCVVNFWRAAIRKPARVIFTGTWPTVIVDPSNSCDRLELPENATRFVVSSLD
jgi:uncharacterized protein YjbI with pentapeptide repeats